jgi:hypothetical protein
MLVTIEETRRYVYNMPERGAQDSALSARAQFLADDGTARMAHCQDGSCVSERWYTAEPKTDSTVWQDAKVFTDVDLDRVRKAQDGDDALTPWVPVAGQDSWGYTE